MCVRVRVCVCVCVCVRVFPPPFFYNNVVLTEKNPPPPLRSTSAPAISLLAEASMAMNLAIAIACASCPDLTLVLLPVVLFN